MTVPAAVGPYRIEERLGEGGMGEVFRAYDQRLDRTVAIKLIRPGAAGEPRVRERFRREARAAAGLSHHAIVQIHDIVETAEGDAIVMELVEGRTLDRLLAPGPLDLTTAVRLASEVAEGLAAAHARGLVHRDLKAENVMVTPGGHAKILDFGLAKRWDGEPEDVTVSVPGVVVGTYRSMSPEQVRGFDVDPRSDLFSFGTLLYEMLAGRSPFQAAAAFDILHRICTLRQPPLAEVRAGVPAALSGLVDRLLEKDPARRPQSAAEALATLGEVARHLSWSEWSDAAGARPASADDRTLIEGMPAVPRMPPMASMAPGAGSAAQTSAFDPAPPPGRRLAALAVTILLVLLAFGALGFYLLRRGDAAPLSVAVTLPEVTAAGALGGGGGALRDEADLMAAGLRAALLRELLAVEGISALTPEQVDPVQGPPVAVARALAADELVTSQLDCGAAVCQVTLRRVGADGRLRWTQSFEIPLDQPHLLGNAVGVHLREGYRDHGRRPGLATAVDASPADYAELLRLRRELDLGVALDPLLARLAALRRRAPRLLEAYLLEAEVRRHRFGEQRDPADLELGFALLQRARELAPADPRPLAVASELALKGGRLERAEEALADLERLQPGDPATLVLRARVLERRGENGQALGLMREAVRLRPSWHHLIRLADMEYRLGEVEAARRHLAELLVRFPGYYSGQALLAQIELLSGSPERAVELYSDLVRRSPQVSELINLGTAYMLLGRFAEAAERFEQSRRLAPRHPTALLSLADAQLLQGEEAAARERYQELLRVLAADPATAADWQLLSARAQALAHLGRGREAAEAAQQILILAQGNAQAAYEVSLVYTLIGDLSSARVNAEQALAQGVAPRWFTFPWFAPLRAAPEFEARLEALSSAAAR